MSQRGSHRIPVPITVHRRRWTYIRNCFALALLLTFGISLNLPAQNGPESPKPMLQVVLCVDGGERQVSLHGGTVADLLAQEGVMLNEHDRVTPSTTTLLEMGMAVRVERVTFEILDEKVSFPPPVLTRWDRRMTVKPVVIREGKAGVALQKRCIWKIDGKISEQWTQSQRIIQKPVPSVVVRGTLTSRGFIGRRTLRMVATAYDPGPGSCGRFATGHTAIGVHAGRGVIAVDPRVIPLGSRVYIEGYGSAIAADVGGAIKGNIIDVCFPTRGEALRWGRRYVDVMILE